MQPLLRSRGAAIIRTPITGCGPRSKCGAASLDTGDSRHAVLGPGTRVQIVDRYTCPRPAPPLVRVMRHVSLLLVSLVTGARAGLLGYGTGEGSCAAAPFRLEILIYRDCYVTVFCFSFYSKQWVPKLLPYAFYLKSCWLSPVSVSR